MPIDYGLDRALDDAGAIEMWDWLAFLIQGGKNIAILGPSGSGKTTLHDFFQGRLVEDPDRGQTIGVDLKRRYQSPVLNFNVKKGLDVPGGDIAPWEDLYCRADRVFYLFDTHKFRTEDDYVVEVGQHAKKLQAWGKELKPKPTAIIGTHADLDPLHAKVGEVAYSDLIRDIDALHILRSRLAGNTPPNRLPFVVGSLATEESSNALLGQVTSQWK